MIGRIFSRFVRLRETESIRLLATSSGNSANAPNTGANNDDGDLSASRRDAQKKISSKQSVIDDLFNLLETQPVRPAAETLTASTDNDGVGGSSFASFSPQHTSGGADFKYWPLYPKKVRKWLINTRSVRGYYDADGKYFPAGQFDHSTPTVLRPIKTFAGPDK
jgi:hypothetical protein